ncbi:HyaD/HybD family hydrogenase maturation endopeptidase [Telmatospirillum siberiense]|uniref:Hydrogenase expression/formation protein HupD n=1 Tax=Telmatospirillum siberiense TaxID=382514 RepID=A0A2N3PSJ4_9PROT|nr:HyaD/HybD family hydrogenase maturation endopeptidase [Telmatospirillum siberiense]PKU23371.1 HyaD/HybD family hydrogenase maturation endopeptidase [Telmatospirillum siberiense]
MRTGADDFGEPTAHTLILGIGNILWADEGFGVRVVEEIHRRFSLPAGVSVMDGGTQGLYLVQYVKAVRRLLVFDAIDYGAEPGTLRVVRDGEVPTFMGCRKLSLHQTGFQDVLAAASLLGGGPESAALVGVQAERLDDWGGSLTETVRGRIEPAIGLGLEILREWGVEAIPRQAADGEGLLLGHDIDLAGYERRPILAERR